MLGGAVRRLGVREGIDSWHRRTVTADLVGDRIPAPSPSTGALVSVRDLSKIFHTGGGFRPDSDTHGVQAVAGVTFDVRRGETLGLVGESGCGKSTLGRSILQIERPSKGSVMFDGQDLTLMRPGPLRRLRRRASMIFQDPHSSLNPRMTAGQIIGEPLIVHDIGDRPSRDARVLELLTRVGLGAGAASRYPHEFSGGQRQRIGIARALAAGPDFIVCDEAVSALDVSVQAQVLNLLTELRAELNLTLLFISHNLGVVRHISDRIAVMYLGKIVEEAPTEEFFSRSLHPYSQALLTAIPIPDPDVESQRERIVLSGDLPSPASPPSGCRFHTRCAYAQPICSEVEPTLQIISPGHTVSCHFWRDIETSRRCLS